MKKDRAPMPLRERLSVFFKEFREFFTDLPWGVKMLWKQFSKKAVWFLGEVADFFIDLPLGIKGMWGLFLEKTADVRADIVQFFKESPQGIRTAYLNSRQKHREKNAQKAERKAIEKQYKIQQENLKKAENPEEHIRRTRWLYRVATAVIALVLCAQLLFCTLTVGFIGYKALADRADSLQMVILTARPGSSKYSKKSKTVPAAIASPDGEQLYIDFTFIADSFSYFTFYEEDSVYYTMTDGRVLEIELGSNHFSVDGAPLMISGAAIQKGGRVYLPLELLTEHAVNVTVSYDPSENKVTLLRNKDDELSGYTQYVFKDLIFQATGIKPAPTPALIEGIKEEGET